MKSIILAVILLALPASTQTIKSPKRVMVFGNSISYFQAPFSRQEFPTIQNASIWGVPGATCSYFLRGNILLAMVPAQTDILVLINSTNDVRTGVPVEQHMNCMRRTVELLLARNPSLRLVLVNTPPWGQGNCYGDARGAIDAYNVAYQSEPWPAHVKVADAYTPMVGSDGWADPKWEHGACLIHPDQQFTWSPAWEHFADSYELLVMQAAQGLW